MCYKCKQAGHKASECDGLKGNKLRLFGFRIKQGFYAIEVPDAKVQVRDNMSSITIVEGQADEKKVEEELKNLIEKSWNWQVKKIEGRVFSAVFPN